MAEGTGSEIRTIGRHTAVYAIGVGINRLAGFIMLPVYTRFLTPADYGVLELLSMTIDLISMVVGIGIAASVFKFYAEAENAEQKRVIISTAALAVITLSALAVFLGMFVSPHLARTMIPSPDGALFFKLFFVIYFVQTAESIPLLLLRAEHKSALFVTVNVAKLLCMLSLNIYFVVYHHKGVLGVLLSNLLVTSVTSSVLSVYMFRRVGLGFSKSYFRTIARFGYPLVLWFVANFVTVFSNRYFINHFVGAAGVGIYSLAAKFVFVISAFAFTPFQMIWDPQRFTIAKRDDAPQIYSRVFLYLNLALGLMALAIGLLVFDTIRVIAAPAFRDAASVVPALLAAQIIFHWTAFSNFGLFLRNKTHTLGYLAAFGVAVVLALNFVLIPVMGIEGAAVAALIAYAIRFVAVYVLAQRQYHIEYPWARVARLYAIVGSAIAVRQLVNHLPIAHSLVVSGSLAVASLVGLYVFVLSDTERSALKALLARPRLILSFGAGRG